MGCPGSVRSSVIRSEAGDDDQGWMSLRRRPMGEFGASDRDSRVLVPRLPIPRRRQRNSERLLPYRVDRWGDVVVFRGDQKHGYRNPGSTPTIAYSVVAVAPFAV